MSSKTRAELVLQTLDDLGVLGAGQTEQIEDTQKINDALPSIIATLRTTEVYYLGDIDSIPEDAFMPLAAIAAWSMRAKFNVTDPNELKMLQEAAATGSATLKVINRGRPTYAPLKTEYI